MLVSIVTYNIVLSFGENKNIVSCAFGFAKDHYCSQRNRKIKTNTKNTNHVFNIQTGIFIQITSAYVYT